MSHKELYEHVSGRANFVDDLELPAGALHGAVFFSKIPHGEIKHLDVQGASAAPGVVAVLTAADIPGENQVGTIVLDETLFAEKEVHFVGQPIALVVASSKVEAQAACRLIKIEYEEKEPVYCPREAMKRGDTIGKTRVLTVGDVDKIWSKCDVIVQDTIETGSQEHVYLETQSAVATPAEHGRVKIISSTQAPTTVQLVAARVLGLPMSAVEVDVERLGGGFGGKEDQATPYAVMAALAAHRLKKTVKVVLSRAEDMVLTGKRHPYSIDYKLGLTREGRALAYEVIYYQNSGAAADLSTAVLERSLFHGTSAYGIPHVRATGYCCRTNLPPFTAFRGFGAPQAVFAIEAAFHRAARELRVPTYTLQEKNLLREDWELPFGMRIGECQGTRAFAEVKELADIQNLEREIDLFNRESRDLKRGFAIVPITFGISFTSTFLNQASALVHIYRDGSVSVSTGAVEMGQGVSRKMRSIAAKTLGILEDRIEVEGANTKRIANSSPTAASTGADLNGRALEMACEAVLFRLKSFAANAYKCRERQVEIVDGEVHLSKGARVIPFEQLVLDAYLGRVSLSASAHYATPGIYFDKEKEKGRPFAYHVFGAAVTVASVDCLRGTYTVDNVYVVHDGGKSLEESIDRGQVEGGVLQSIGWMTMEDLPFIDGVAQAANLATYKVPDIMSMPQMEIRFLENVKNPKAVRSSKAVGEPPFLYGLGAYFAILNAISAFRPDQKPIYNPPFTPEKVLTFLHPSS